MLELQCSQEWHSTKTPGQDGRLTTEGDDVAAVLMHKLPRHSLLHDLLHLQDRLGKTWNFSYGPEGESCGGVGAQGAPLLPGFPSGTRDFTKD